MKKTFFTFLLVILFIVIIPGCGIGEDKNKAEIVANAYFEAIKNNDYETALTFYSPVFFEKTPREEALQKLQSMNNKCGNLLSYKPNSWKINNIVKGGRNVETGTIIGFTYEVTYVLFTITEDIRLFRPSSSNEIKIQGYTIRSNKLESSTN
jgi:hypothetical protein